VRKQRGGRRGEVKGRRGAIIRKKKWKGEVGTGPPIG